MSRRSKQVWRRSPNLEQTLDDDEHEHYHEHSKLPLPLPELPL